MGDSGSMRENHKAVASACSESCQKYTFPGATPDLQTQTLCGRQGRSLILA